MLECFLIAIGLILVVLIIAAMFFDSNDIYKEGDD